MTQAGDVTYYPKVIRLAATGNAAYLIDGTTLHTGLRFHWKPKYVGLTDEVMESLRRQFEHLMCIVIDEMSLLGIQ